MIIIIEIVTYINICKKDFSIEWPNESWHAVKPTNQNVCIKAIIIYLVIISYLIPYKCLQIISVK